jgi:hypothetical protein
MLFHHRNTGAIGGVSVASGMNLNQRRRGRPPQGEVRPCITAAIKEEINIAGALRAD